MKSKTKVMLLSVLMASIFGVCNLGGVARLSFVSRAAGTPPAGQTLIYNGDEQALITAGSPETGNTMEYSLEQNGVYSSELPKGKDQGPYTVYYREKNGESVVDAGSVSATINKANLTIKANEQAVVKGQSISQTNSEITVTGLQTGDVLQEGTVTLTANTASTGTFDEGITPSGGVIKDGDEVVTDNYEITYTKGKLVVVDALAITTASFPEGSKGVTYTVTLEASGGTSPYTWSVGTSQLPAGINLSAETISGSTSSIGVFPVTVTVTDSKGLTQSKDFALSITAAPEITTTALKDAEVGVPYKEEIKFSGNPTVSFTQTGLPGSLKFVIDGAKIYIQGTPVAAEVKSYDVKITATNSKGSVSRDYTLKVKGVDATGVTLSPNTAQIISPNEKVTFTAKVEPENATNKTVTWDSSDKTVATVDANGVVTGLKAGTTDITAKTADGTNLTSAAVQVTVDDSKPLITTSELTKGAINVKYTDLTLAASNTTGTPTWTHTGNLPTGMALSTDGKLTGTPTQAGSFKVTIKVECTVSGVKKSDSKAFTLEIVDGSVQEGTPVANTASGSAVKGLKDGEKILDDFMTAQKPESGKEVSYTFELVEKAPAAADKTAIENELGKLFNGLKTNQYKVLNLDMSVVKRAKITASGANETPVNVPDLGRVAEIHLTVDSTVTQYLNTLQLIRNHTGTGAQGVKVFERLTAQPAKADWKDGTFYANGTDLYIYTRYFSAYAIAYSTVDTWRVSFNTRGGNAMDPMLVVKGTTLTVTDPTREGQVFNGWYTDSALSNLWDATSVVSQDMTLYASWAEESESTGPRRNSRGTEDTDELTPRGSRTGDNNEAERIARLLAIMTTTWIVLFNALAFGKKRRQRIRRR